MYPENSSTDGLLARLPPLICSYVLLKNCMIINWLYKKNPPVSHEINLGFIWEFQCLCFHGVWFLEIPASISVAKLLHFNNLLQKGMIQRCKVCQSNGRASWGLFYVGEWCESVKCKGPETRGFPWWASWSMPSAKAVWRSSCTCTMPSIALRVKGGQSKLGFFLIAGLYCVLEKLFITCLSV